MFKGKKILGLIPARGGSKGLPQKNVKSLLGKPLIAWTFEQSLASKYLDQVIVSTDDKEIASVSERFGVKVPFVRSEELATDEARMVDVVLHAINWFENNDRIYDLIVLLQPTSPTRITGDIDNAIELLFKKGASSIISVCEDGYPQFLSNTLPEDGSMKNFVKDEHLGKNRQELPQSFRINGAVYVVYSDYLKKEKEFLGNNTYAYIMPGNRSIDIDNMIDFKLAELILQESL